MSSLRDELETDTLKAKEAKKAAELEQQLKDQGEARQYIPMVYSACLEKAQKQARAGYNNTKLVVWKTRYCDLGPEMTGLLRFQASLSVSKIVANEVAELLKKDGLKVEIKNFEDRRDPASGGVSIAISW